MRALIGQTVVRHIRFPCANAAFRFHTTQQKRNCRIGKGQILILVLVLAPAVLMLASRSLHSYAFGAKERVVMLLNHSVESNYSNTQ